jgi:hypothetical protein
MVRLAAADAQPFYERFGFQPKEQVQFSFPMARLLLRRGAAEIPGVETHGSPQPELGVT